MQNVNNCNVHKNTRWFRLWTAWLSRTRLCTKFNSPGRRKFAENGFLYNFHCCHSSRKKLAYFPFALHLTRRSICRVYFTQNRCYSSWLCCRFLFVWHKPFLQENSLEQTGKCANDGNALFVVSILSIPFISFENSIYLRGNTFWALRNQVENIPSLHAMKAKLCKMPLACSCFFFAAAVAVFAFINCTIFFAECEIQVLWFTANLCMRRAMRHYHSISIKVLRNRLSFTFSSFSMIQPTLIGNALSVKWVCIILMHLLYYHIPFIIFNFRFYLSVSLLCANTKTNWYALNGILSLSST